jgi:hypothetical protein
MGSAILLLSHFDNLFPALLMVSFLGLAASNLFPNRDPSLENNCLSILCKEDPTNWISAILLLGEVLSACILLFSVNGFTQIAKTYLQPISFLGLVCSLFLLLLTAGKLSTEDMSKYNVHAIDSETVDAESIALKQTR